jgi:putative peptidoglycan lipid II flippase
MISAIISIAREKIVLWSKGSSNRRIFVAAAIVSSLSLLVKVAALIRDIIIARRFGTTDEMDAFVMAFTLNTWAVTLFMSSLNFTLLPNFIQRRETAGRPEAQRLLHNVCFMALVALLVVGTVLGLWGAKILPLIAKGFSSDKLSLTRVLCLILLPATMLSGLTSTCAAVLNAEKRFRLVSIAPVITPILSIFTLFTFPSENIIISVKHLSISVAIGLLCEFTILTFGVRLAGFNITPKWLGLDAATVRVLRQMSLRLIAAMLMSSIPVIEQSIASRLGPGNIAMLNYSNKMLAVILGITATSLGTVVSPHFAQAIAKEDWQTVRLLLRKYTKLIFAFSIPAIAAVAVLSEPVVKLLFERGSFSHGATLQVSKLQIAYAFQMPFYILGFIYAPLIASLNASSIMVVGNLLSVSLTVLLNSLLTPHFGILGVAISSTGVYTVAFLFVRIVLGFKFQHLFKVTAISN